MLQTLNFDNTGYLTNSGDAANQNAVGKQSNSGLVAGTSEDKNQATISAPKLQASVDAAINKFILDIQTTANTEKTPQMPSAALAALVGKAVASGAVGEELNRWITVVDVVIGNLEDSPEAADILNKLSAQADPQIVKLAATSGRPELLRVWTVVQEMELPAAEAPQGSAGQNVSAPGSLLNVLSQGDKEALRGLLQNLVNSAGGDTSPKNFGLSQPALLSRVGQFEMLVSSLGSGKGDMSKLLAALPAAVADVEKLLPSRDGDNEAAKVYDTLARSAPKWLRNLAEQTKSPALVDFWVSAKVADLAPWLHMSSAERQETAATLKELASTFEQPEAFRATVDDGAARGMTLQMALYAPGAAKPYPALIQVYEEKRDRGQWQPPEQEIWVRVSLETDHIGPVDLSFRLQDKKYLSVFTRFAKPGTAAAFRECLSEIRSEFAGSTLELKKIAVTERSTGAGGAGSA